MTYFPDLETISYFRDDAPWLRGVGWLEAGQPYDKGSVSAEDVAALERLAVSTWQPVFAMGWHNCSLCGRTDLDEPFVRPIQGQNKLLGADNMFVPSGDVMYVAPTLVLHYIDAHGYRPPEEFLRAVRTTDPTRPDYQRACEGFWTSGPQARRG
jgi:hypothetical protein